ncbi:MAG TPA: hybrid sensor histidine kinase/response regulator [Polyangiaceae bacterium]|nr:hybrid sensor histidine kinase/response regulator [Polyangiaceae bacterium]
MARAVNLLNERVLVLMPTARDAQRTTSLLQEAGMHAAVCSDLPAVCRELRAGAGALLMTDEPVMGDFAGQLAEVMREQPPWSAVPVVVVAGEGAAQRLERLAFDWLRGLIVVERPVRTRTLLSVVLSALRGRRDQYRIRDAIQQLARQAEQLREADRRKDEFLATLAHELRNPLAPIQTGVDLLGLPHDDQAQKRALTVMNRQLRHMVRMIDDLLDVSRITQGKLELKRSWVTLGDVLDAAVEASRPIIERHEHTLRKRISEPSLRFEADPTRIAQVVSNLLNNASKYTRPGGVIELITERQGRELSIQVRDTGIGIPAEQLHQIFDMFSQINRETDRSQGGLGIGLALVRSLVEMHQGSVVASSEGPGRGSCFTIRLPVDREAGGCDSQPQARSSALPPRDRRRVLVVDDNDDAADMLALMLQNAEYDTSKASDGPSALAAAEAWTPDVVILDIGLPGMSGYDVARELRRRGSQRRLELIALTGWGSHEDKQKAIDAGFDVHLTKPVDADKLYGALANLEAAPAWQAARPAPAQLSRG